MTYSVNLRKRTTRFLYSTLRVLVVEAGVEVASGTAFFFEHFPDPQRPAFVVTNKHVIEGSTFTRLRCHTGKVANFTAFAPTGEEWVDVPTSEWLHHPTADIDLCALPVARLKQLAGGRLDQLFFTPIRSHRIPTTEMEVGLAASVAVTMIGYPTGLWDRTNNLPVLRRGTTATHPSVDFNGKPEFLVDIAVFPGSSGSPIVTFEEDAAEVFLGVLYAGPTFSAEGQIVITNVPVAPVPTSVTPVMIHLGAAIKSRAVLQLTHAVSESPQLSEIKWLTGQDKMINRIRG